MPFPNQQPIPFTRDGVERLLAGSTGCYGILSGDECVYVGRAECIRSRLQQHLADGTSDIFRHRPTHFITVVSANPVTLEKTLILELRPCCNQKVG